MRAFAVCAACATVVFALIGSAAAALPREGVLVPGRSLGGLELGATSAQVKAAWGQKFGRCRNCAATTWYFNLRPFKPEGAGVEFRAGRVAAIFTLWRPQGWRTSRGVAVGENAARIAAVYGPLPRTDCGLYSALTLRRGRTETVFYLLGEQVWGFALSRRGVPLCR